MCPFSSKSKLSKKAFYDKLTLWRFQVDGEVSSVIVRDVDEDLDVFQVVDLIFLTLTSLRCYGDNHFFTATEVPIQNKREFCIVVQTITFTVT